MKEEEVWTQERLFSHQRWPFLIPEKLLRSLGNLISHRTYKEHSLWGPQLCKCFSCSSVFLLWQCMDFHFIQCTEFYHLSPKKLYAGLLRRQHYRHLDFQTLQLTWMLSTQMETYSNLTILKQNNTHANQTKSP